jgi:hypothetical protein
LEKKKERVGGQKHPTRNIRRQNSTIKQNEETKTLGKIVAFLYFLVNQTGPKYTFAMENWKVNQSSIRLTTF